MTDQVQFPKAFAVSFRDLERWSVAFYCKVHWKWPDEVMNTLASCLLRVKIPVDCSPEAAPIIEKITFGGKLSILPEGERKDYKGKLFRADSGQLIYSKIRVKQGSVCIVPMSFKWVAVSSEYPTYSLDRSRIDATYLELVLRSSAFKHYLDGLSHGGSTKTRIAPDEFEKLLIPIPPLAMQQVIKNRWRKMNQEYFAKLEQIQLLENQCHELVQEYLDINIPPPRKIGKLFLLHLSKTERWSFEYNKRVLSGLAQIQTGKYRSYPLGELCKGQSGSTPSKNNPSFWKNGEIPWVSPKDMKTRYISDSQDHISQNAIEYNASPVVKKGSILFVVRSGILQRKVPVAMTQVDVSINQDIRSFTPRTDNILPEFLLAYFEAKQDDLLRLVKWSTTVQSINKEELETFPIPLPPKDIQEKIAITVAELQSKMETLEKESNDIHLNAKHKIEEMILGTRPVECS